MSKPASSNGGKEQAAIKALTRRAERILEARPAYKEMVDFYLDVFRLQIEWRGRLAFTPQEVTEEEVGVCLKEGSPLIGRFDPALGTDDLLELWGEMKAVYARGNEVLRQAVSNIEEAEKAGGFAPGPWLSEQRPDRGELVADAARLIGIDEPVLASLARATTFPLWDRVAQTWLPKRRLDEWRRFRCPTCGGPPGLVELRAASGSSGTEGVKPAVLRLMHCPFCGSRWVAPGMACPSCGSTKAGDAKYLFTKNEPEWRIDFCKGCRHYLKVIDGDKVHGRVHVGLELLTAAHLDMLAREKQLTPMEVCA
jgi:FdhE protein